MSCGEKLKIERLKELRHARILAQIEANQRNRVLAVVKKTHHCYGDYYIGIDYEEARRDKLHIYRKCEPR